MAFALSVPLAAQGTVLWRGDFETGNRDQWTRLFAPSSDRIALQRPAVPNGSSWAVRTELRPGDVAIKLETDGSVLSTSSMACRSELVRSNAITEGTEHWYRFQMMVPPDFDSRDDKTGGIVFAQWHHTGGGSPPTLFVVEPTRLKLVAIPSQNATPQTIMDEPLIKGQWHTFVFHAIWSSSATRGLYEVWLDGTQRVSKRMPTMFAGTTNYIQSGQYRRVQNTKTTVVWIDGWTIATAREDVMPAEPPPTEPAPTEPPPPTEPAPTDPPPPTEPPTEPEPANPPPTEPPPTTEPPTEPEPTNPPPTEPPPATEPTPTEPPPATEPSPTDPEPTPVDPDPADPEPGTPPDTGTPGSGGEDPATPPDDSEGPNLPDDGGVVVLPPPSTGAGDGEPRPARGGCASAVPAGAPLLAGLLLLRRRRRADR